MTICPVCNGLAPFRFACPRCDAAMRDEGRQADWLGPYAPYEPNHDEHLTDRAALDGVCRHAASCPDCGNGCEVSIVAWD